jgi:hypothetical protein
MNGALRRLVELVEQFDLVLQKASVREFQRVVTVIANASPGDLSLLGSSGAMALQASSVNSPHPAVVSPILCLVQNDGNTSRLIRQASPAGTHECGVYATASTRSF